MIPVIALVGRPNVGKSTIFNQLTRSRDALVADFPGLTRDRKYGEGKITENGTVAEKRFIVIDTGGISGDEAGIDAAMAEQSLAAMREANIVLFIVDAQTGVTAADELIAKHLRVNSKETWLVVNKVDGQDPNVAAADFYRLGFERVRFTAAAHNRGVQSLIEEVMAPFDPQPTEEERQESGIRVGVIGRPNVGKSTLVNRLLGEDRVVVYDQPGTTRDSIYIPYERQGQRYTLIDTAGVRRRKNVQEMVEKFSIIKTLQAVEDAHVVILVIDARTGLVDQDLHLLGFAMEAGRALIIAVNKWDGMEKDAKDDVKRELDRRLNFIDYAPIHFISALHGTGVGDLYKPIHRCYESAMAKWSTNMLTRILEDAVQEHQPPLVRGRRIKLRYAHQGGSNPPIIVVHGNQTSELPNSYKRYLENLYRRVLKVTGTPIRFEFKSGENPFAGKVNKLTPRQQHKRERVEKQIRKIKKSEKKGKR